MKMDGGKQTEGHRKRLRERFTKSKFDGFHDYEIIELLLTYAIPRKDTKPIAKALLQRFKTIRQILDLPTEELKQIDGLGESASVFLKIIRETIAKYFQDATHERKTFLKLDDLAAYIRATIGGRQNEILYALYLNSKNELISAEDLGEGTVTEAVAFPRKIVENALRYKATAVIIAHNHPGGVAEPSRSDDAMTKAIRDALKTVDVDLQEHIIISDDAFYSYRKNGFFD